MGVLNRTARTANDGEALVRMLYQEHGRALLAYAQRLTGDRTLAEDVLQETLVRAWKHPEIMTRSGSLRGWLLTVARNIVIDRARASARATEILTAPPDQAATGPTVHDHADGVANAMIVMTALARLSRNHREVLEQIFFHDHSVAQAADELKIPPGTVKSRTYHALKSLREDIGTQDRKEVSA